MRAAVLGLGIATLWLSLIVLLPLAAVVRVKSTAASRFWSVVTSPRAIAALVLTLVISLARGGGQRGRRAR